VAISFIVGGNRSTWRKPQTCRKSLTNFITKNVVSSTPKGKEKEKKEKKKEPKKDQEVSFNIMK
jgi:hypothetical protein